MSDNVKSLLDYLAERAHELATLAHAAKSADSVALIKEAQELMAIRSNIIGRSRLAEDEAQLHLPLEVQRAA